MKAIIPVFQENSSSPLYLQLYDYIRQAILAQEIVPGEKLPSLRDLSSSLGLSLTTVEGAYNQLAVEGYIESRPKSGYYVCDVSAPASGDQAVAPHEDAVSAQLLSASPHFKYDMACFDFVKWKKCLNRVINEYPEALLSEGEPRGEAALREEISRYVYRSRGVRCKPEQIVIAAGTQQITALLASMLDDIGVRHVAVEEPGYLPIRGIFRSRGFALTPVPVARDGIDIARLPSNIRCAAYVNPSNQFPTGAVLSVGKRYRLLEWADQNNSYIIEDDYDSELRYFGRPIPALQGLDHSGRVIYLESFSSTLFPAVRISYTVLPPPLSRVYDRVGSDSAQTCSKVEQLTLALFMARGYYQTGIRRLRRLYAQKLQRVLAIVSKAADIDVENAVSGIHMMLHVRTPKPASRLCQEARELGLRAVPVTHYAEKPSSTSLLLYYNQIPLEEIDDDIRALLARWRS
jgi:GntR family transcriptional regulator/MocR family aminotransferase